LTVSPIKNGRRGHRRFQNRRRHQPDKRIEKQLSESEERYRTLFNSIDQGFCLCEVIV
jgi:PAS domain-containing protein